MVTNVDGGVEINGFGGNRTIENEIVGQKLCVIRLATA